MLYTTLTSIGTRIAALIGAAVAVGATTSYGSERRFAYSYETTTATQGTWEYEQWFTWKQGEGFDKYQFRHELEYGLTERLQLGLYLFDWEYEEDGDESATAWGGSGIELIYQLTDPNTSPLGSALYFESLVSDEELSLEGKLLLQKNFGPLTAVYNFVVEAEWEDDFEESKGVVENTFGLSYQLKPSLLFGVEALHEVEFEDWSEAGDHVFYAGPNLSFRKGGFFATVAGLFQVTDVAGEPDTQLRIIAGIHF
jgi:hypothetical protein